MNLAKGEFNMTVNEKLNILEDLLDIEKDTLREDIELEQLGEWDSIAVISTIAMFDSIFGKEISPDEIKGFKTIKDIMDKME
jgi:acyl carrier protein